MGKNNVNTTTPSTTGVITLVAAVLALVTTTVMIIPSSAAYAENLKTRSYTSESGEETVFTFCSKDGVKESGTNCSQTSKDTFGAPQNPDTRESCETESGEKCKKTKINP